MARLVAQAMDPYYFVDVMPNGFDVPKMRIFKANLISVVCRRVSCRIAYVLNYISYALMIAALCFVFLSFNMAVYSATTAVLRTAIAVRQR